MVFTLRLEKIRFLLKLLQMIHAFHNGMPARVIFDGDISEPFNLRCGVKHRCVMAPTLFAIYQSTLLGHAFPSQDRIALHTRNGRNLFHLAHLRAKMKTNTFLIHKVIFATDMAFCTHMSKLQKICNTFSASCNLLGLKINTKKR